MDERDGDPGHEHDSCGTFDGSGVTYGMARRRGTRTMLTGLLTALVWVCSLFPAPDVGVGMRRELERALPNAAPVVAASASIVRVVHDVVPRHGGFHSSGASDAPPSAYGFAVQLRATLPSARGPQVTPARHRIAPHDATAPPADVRIA
jgi:hypothetical protein